MPTIREALRRAAEHLEAAGVPDAACDAALLLSHVTGEPQLSLRADAGRQLAGDTVAAFEALVARRAQREPLQYITGEAWFMGLCLKTAPGVLIPRFDTETLCQQAIDRMQGGERVLDLCTGSGALAVAIAHRFPGARVFAGDISPDAAVLARENAARCGWTSVCGWAIFSRPLRASVLMSSSAIRPISRRAICPACRLRCSGSPRWRWTAGWTDWAFTGIL